MSGLGIDWDAEDAAEQAARQPKIIKRQETVAVENAPANAIVPPLPAATKPMTAAAPPPMVSQQNTQAPPSFAESIYKQVSPYLNPIHLKPGITEYKSYEDIDPYATAAHGIGEYLAYQHGIKPIVGGIGQGVSNRISNSISGIDPTIRAQIGATNDKIASSEKIAAMKYGQAQGPDRQAVATTVGRIEPTFDISPIPAAQSMPDTPPVIKTAPVEAMPKPNPLDVYSQQKYGLPLAELEKASGGELTKQSDVDIIGSQVKRGQGITVNTLPGTISNKPAGIPGIVSPMNQLTGQTTMPAPTSVSDAVSTGQNPTQALNESIAKDIDAETVKKVTPVSSDTAIKVEGLVRDAKGNFQYPEGMSPAAIQGHKSFVQQYPEIAANLEAQGKFGILGGGAADNNLKNSYGKDLRKTILNELNQGQMGGSYPNYFEKINPAIQALPQESGLGKTLAELRVNNPKGGVQGPLGVPASINKTGELVIPKEASNIIKSAKTGVPSALIKAGGPALLLMSITNAADAAQKGDMAPSKELGFDLATGALLAKLLGGPAAAAGALAFGSSSLGPNEQQELARRRQMAPTIRGSVAPPAKR